jgi:cytochrome c oxidase assembly factor CtaG
VSPRTPWWCPLGHSSRFVRSRTTVLGQPGQFLERTLDGVLLAAAYTGPSELTPTRILTSWTVDVPTVLLMLVLGGAYTLGVRRVRAAGAGWPLNRVAAFGAGVLLLGLLGCSFLGVYSGVLFWVRAAQNMLALMVVPLLLALGAPLTLVLAAVPVGVAARLRAVGRGRVLRFLTFPLVMTVVLVGPLIVLYLTPLYKLSLRHAAVGLLARLVLVAGGFLYFWTRVQLDPTPRGGSHVVSFAISLTEAVADGVLGVVLWQGPAVAPAYYLALARPWGPSVYTDQVFGAGMLWIGGDVAGLPFLFALFLRWMRDDERQAGVEDAELDRAEQVVELQVPTDGSEPAAAPGLWWETDENLAERFRRR